MSGLDIIIKRRSRMSFVWGDQAFHEVEICERQLKSPLASTIQDSLDQKDRETIFFSDSTETKQNKFDQIMHWFEQKGIKMGDPESLKETFFESKKSRVIKGFTSEIPANSSHLSKRIKKMSSLLCARSLLNQF